MTRRGLHRALWGACAAAVLGSPAIAQPRVGGEVALSGHGGSVSGYTAPLGCGYAGIARGTLGGAGIRARVRVRDEVLDGSVNGLVAVVQGGIEHRVHTSEPSGAEASSIPEDRTLFGGSFEVGYDGTAVGFRGGVLLREMIEETDARCPYSATSPCVRPPRYDRVDLRMFPQSALRFGRRDRFYFELGAGAHDPAFVLRPWGYCGVVGSFGPGADFALRVGYQWTFADNVPFRIDLSGTIPLGQRFGLGLGAGIAASGAGLGGDGRASLALRFKR